LPRSKTTGRAAPAPNSTRDLDATMTLDYNHSAITLRGTGPCANTHATAIGVLLENAGALYVICADPCAPSRKREMKDYRNTDFDCFVGFGGSFFTSD